GNLGAATSTATNLVFDGGTLQYTGSTATSDRAFTINAGKTGTIDVPSGVSLTLAGATGTTTTGALTKTNSGTLNLSGVNTYTGTTTISAGTFAITGSGSLNSGSYAGSIVNNATFIYSSSATQTLSGVISGTGVLTKDTSSSSVLTLSNTNTYSGITTISAGTISISADTNLGAVPGSVAATQLTLSGGILQTTADLTLATNRGITLSTGGGTINVNSSTTTIYGGTISGLTTFTKDGAGTFVLTGTKTDNDGTNPTYVIIKQGRYIVRSNNPVILSQTFTGAGDLVIEPAGTDFSTIPLDTLNIKLVDVVSGVPNSGLLGTLTVGKSGNTSRINISGALSTVGNQTFYGPVTLSDAITLTTTSGTVWFTGAVNSNDATPRNLTISGGILKIDGIVGGTAALNNITTTNGGALDLNAAISGAASLTVAGVSDLGANVTTSGAQTYTGAVTVSGTGPRTLQGTTITNSSTLNGGGIALAITGNSSIGGAITSVTNFSVSGTTGIGANVSTT
ncbi:MAG: hypothetical protein EBT01_02955, partial [Proteobacteria bacterium]|nr:hypothetical protein [Candidatus Fonsibacter sp. PEL3]